VILISVLTLFAKAYSTVNGLKQGSPLLVHTQNQAAALADVYATAVGDSVIVEHAMSLRSPSIDVA